MNFILHVCLLSNLVHVTSVRGFTVCVMSFTGFVYAHNDSLFFSYL